MKLKVSLAQLSPVLGDISANLARHLETADAAAREGVDLLVFPELSLTGYRLRELAFSVAIQASAEDKIFAALLNASRQLDMVVGFVEKDERQRYFISAAYLAEGRTVHVHRKVYLPTYGMFDEGRYFAHGDSVRAFDTRFGRMGILVCEDFWHISPPYLLWLDGAELLILTSSAPGRVLDLEEKMTSAGFADSVNQAYAKLFTNFIVHVNRAGVEDDVTYFGGSTIYGPDGNEIVPPTYNREGLFTADLDLDQLRHARIRLPLLRDERGELTARELRRILKNNDR